MIQANMIQAKSSTQSNAQKAHDSVEHDATYQKAWSVLNRHASNHPNCAWLSHILVSHCLGLSQLPSRIGLDAAQFAQLAGQLFPTLLFFHWQQQVTTKNAIEKGVLRQQLMQMRESEWQDTAELLLSHRRGADESEIWVAQIVAVGCLSSQHLWQDLGLESRPMLRHLLSYNFPSLVEKNIQNMRWKKFFYKQLCEQEGGYICRSPTCEQCSSYEECFEQ